MVLKVMHLMVLSIIMSCIFEVYMAAINPLPIHKKMRICSRALSDTLALVCNNSYNTWNDTSEPHLVGGVGGIVEECCEIGCTLSQLEEYCL